MKNDSASPVHNVGFDEWGNPRMLTEQYGLTKRELLAAMAMQGFLADREHINILASVDMPGPSIIQQRIAHLSVRHADALLNELSKEDRK